VLHPHTSNAPSLSHHRALAATLLSRGSTVGETPLHCLPTRGDPVIELAYPSFPSPAPWSELSGTRVAGGRAPVSSRARQWLPVHGRLGRHGPQIRGLGPRVFLQQNNSWKIPFPGTSYLGPSSFPKSTRNPHIYRKPLGFSKIFTKIHLATF
jgi:hypothetical protein